MPWYFVQHFSDPLDQKLCTYVRRWFCPCWRWLPLIGQVSVLQQCNGRKSASTEMLLASRAKVLRLLRSQTGLLMIGVLQEILAMFGLSKTVLPGSSMYVRCIPPHLAQGLGCVSRTARGRDTGTKSLEGSALESSNGPAADTDSLHICCLSEKLFLPKVQRQF